MKWKDAEKERPKTSTVCLITTYGSSNIYEAVYDANEDTFILHDYQNKYPTLALDVSYYLEIPEPPPIQYKTRDVENI